MEECYENYVIIDAGANLVSKKFSRDLDGVVGRAKDSGVQKIIVTGTSVKSSRDSLRLAHLYPQCIYSTAGMHPHDAHSFTEESWIELRSIALNGECVAIGECGLDFSKDLSTADEQKTVFRKHIELAIELNKPLYLHEKNAHVEFIDVLENYKNLLPPVVMHSFTGNLEEATTYLKCGFYLALNGFMCKDKTDSGIRKLLTERIVPLDRLLVETDSPFMYPNTRASKLSDRVKQSITPRSLTFLNRYCTFQRNEPCSLPTIIEIIAALMKKKPEEIALATAFNTLKVFGLP